MSSENTRECLIADAGTASSLSLKSALEEDTASRFSSAR